MMKVSVFTAGKFRFEEQHIRRIISVCPSAAVTVATSEEHLLSFLPETEVLVCGNYNYKASWLNSAGKLKWIHSIAAGNEKIIPSLVNKPIALTDSSGIHAIPIAEQVVGYMLMFERKLLAAVRSQEKKEWAKDLAPGELNGKAVLVVGLGAVGRGIARLCKGLGMKVIATKREASAAAAAEVEDLVDGLYPAESITEFLASADYVVLSLPYTKETHHMFGAAQFSAMKPEAYFINIARGSVVDEEALIAALKERKISGVALDVFETEPLPEESPLWEMENVIITPHNAGLTPHYMDRAVDIFCRNLEAYVERRPVQNLVDKGKGY